MRLPRKLKKHTPANVRPWLLMNQAVNDATKSFRQFSEAMLNMADFWVCGDCGRLVPKSETKCGRPFDDYIGLRGGSIESAIQGAVAKRIDPMVRAAILRLDRRL